VRRIPIVVVVAALGCAMWWAAAGAPGQVGGGAAGVAANPAAAEAKRVKLDAAKQMYEITAARPGAPAMESRYTWSRRWMEAERDAAADDAGRRAAVDAHADRMKALAEQSAKLHDAGRLQFVDACAARYYAAEAEQWRAEAAGPRPQ
jgi:hypothetical protein